MLIFLLESNLWPFRLKLFDYSHNFFLSAGFETTLLVLQESNKADMQRHNSNRLFIIVTSIVEWEFIRFRSFEITSYFVTNESNFCRSSSVGKYILKNASDSSWDIFFSCRAMDCWVYQWAECFSLFLNKEVFGWAELSFVDLQELNTETSKSERITDNLLIIIIVVLG